MEQVGFSIGLYARVKGIDNKKAYKELLERECYSQEKTMAEISPINLISDIEIRDAVYREFLNMLKLEGQHKNYLKNIGFLNSSIEDNLYKSVPKNYIKRRLICNALAKKYNLAGIPGMYQEEDFKWCFSRVNGFYVPVVDENGYIQALSIHLDKSFTSSDIWFSSNGKINGTGIKNYTMKSNIYQNSENVIIVDTFLMGQLIQEVTNEPIIAFQNISNSYTILKEIQDTDIKNIKFVTRVSDAKNNMDYIINRIFRDLLPLGYNLDIKCIKDCKDILKIDFFENNFDVENTSNKIA